MIPIILLAACCAQAGDEGQTIKLGGPRQATATVQQTEADYVVTVRLRPVAVFDTATNARLNRNLAWELGLQALARHLAGQKNLEFFVSGARLEKPAMEGKFYRQTLRVPRAGVQLAQAGKEEEKKTGADKKAERVLFTSELFTRKGDYHKTLAAMAALSQEELQTIEDLVGADPGKYKDFLNDLAQLEKRSQDNLGRLAQEIKADLLLFSSDQNELLATLAGQNKQWRQLVAQAQKRCQPKEKKEKTP